MKYIIEIPLVNLPTPTVYPFNVELSLTLAGVHGCKVYLKIVHVKRGERNLRRGFSTFFFFWRCNGEIFIRNMCL